MYTANTDMDTGKQMINGHSSEQSFYKSLTTRFAYVAAALFSFFLMTACSSANDNSQSTTAEPNDTAEQTIAVTTEGNDPTHAMTDGSASVATVSASSQTNHSANNSTSNPSTNTPNDTRGHLSTNNPIRNQSLVTNPTAPGTPEDTVKQALDTLYYGDAKQAAQYYQVDMANFADELANTQYAFQQTVERVSFTQTQYNEDKTHAQIDGEIKLKGQDKPEPLTYRLQKINGQWKILG